MEQILVVEDNPMNMELTVVLLESWGYLVGQAEDGAQALMEVRNGNYDLILLDMQLPRMDGLEVLENLKNDPETADIPVVALTAHSMTGDGVKFLDAGCTGYISKPINVPEFRDQISDYLKGSA
ncbi:response regulator [Methanococcoides methylutens]|uniref:response regulator n=1 Tax=Methanococcoides methylutens TaxID=2226 RepID=UPI00404493E3